MPTTSNLIAESRETLSEIIEAEGELTPDQESRLNKLMEQKEGKAQWLRALYRRCETESELYENEIKVLQAKRKKAQSTAAWAKTMMLEILLVRSEAGEDTNIPHVCHLMKTKTIKYPISIEDWPVAFINEGKPKLDKTAITKAMKRGEQVAGCEWIEMHSVVIK